MGRTGRVARENARRRMGATRAARRASRPPVGAGGPADPGLGPASVAPPPNPSLRQRLRYRFDQTLARGSSALIAWLAVATFVLVAFFSAIVLIGGFAPEGGDGEGRPGVIRQLFNSLLRAMDPGTIGGDDGSATFLVLMLLLTLGGLLVVSALIGVIASGIDERLLELRKGRSLVVESGHTLILGWAETVFTVLSELAVANESERDPVVVVLADRDKVEMEDAIRERAGDLGKTRVVARSGSPIDLNDLAIVRPQEAASIIVLSPETQDPDADVIKTILALTGGPHRREEPYHIVAEIQDPANLEAARLVGGDEAVLVDKRETIARLVVQTSRQSGASIVYTELLDFDGDELYFREEARLVGRPFGEALMAYEHATVVGVLPRGGRPVLNPPADRVLEAGDRLIAIAEDDAALEAAGAAQAQPDEDAIVASTVTPEDPCRMLLVGWNERAAIVLRELDEYLAEGSQVVVAADGTLPDEVFAQVSRGLSRIDVARRSTRAADRRALEDLGIETFDHAVVLSELRDADDDPQRSDARTLITLLHLRDIAAKREHPVSIVSEMLDDRNRQLAQVTKVDDVIVSDEILSLLLAQVSENHHLAAVFEELLGAEGSEVYLRAASLYVREGVEVSFATVVEAARRRGETAIGFREAALADDAEAGYGVVVNPAKSERFVPADGDRVIVLAER